MRTAIEQDLGTALCIAVQYQIFAEAGDTDGQFCGQLTALNNGIPVIPQTKLKPGWHAANDLGERPCVRVNFSAVCHLCLRVGILAVTVCWPPFWTTT